MPTNDVITTHTIFRDLYEYDDLNRIKEDNGVQKDTANNWTTPHKQSFNYDQWGNRTINGGGTFGTNINNKSFEIDTATNRMCKPGADVCTGTQSGMCYDKAGNQTFDDYSTTTTMSGGLREYDGENRLTKANGGPGLSYYGYDADGQRTRRITGGVEYWQVYGFDGELIAEYPANGVASYAAEGIRLSQTITAPPLAECPSGTSRRRHVHGESSNRVCSSGLGPAGHVLEVEDRAITNPLASRENPFGAASRWHRSVRSGDMNRYDSHSRSFPGQSGDP